MFPSRKISWTIARPSTAAKRCQLVKPLLTFVLPPNALLFAQPALIGQDPKKGPVYAIPYDFDAAGLVNAPYAIPPAKLPVRNVRQRLYRGFCAHNETVEEGRQRFLGNEQAILALVRDEPLLNSSTRKKALKFLEDFFDTLKDDRGFQKKIIAKCRK